MKIIIAGDGKVGASLTRQLSSEGYDLTLIDENPNVLEASLERYDVIGIHGNCASMSVLRQAGAEDADLLIAATGADEINLLCCMTAHVINPRLHTIARIRNPEYTDQIYEMSDAFALSLAFNPEKQAAEEIERLLKYPGFLRRDSFANGRVQIVELRIDAGSKLCNIPLSAMNETDKCQVLVCTVLRDGTAITPDGSFVLKEGDRIFVTAPTRNLTILLKSLGIITKRAKRVILCGGGKISLYLANLLTKEGVSVHLIENRKEHCLDLAAMLPSVCVIHGDAGNQSVLESERLDDCDALVALTGLDEINIIISLYAIRRGVPQIITKLGRMDDTSIVNNLSLGSVIRPKELCCDTIVRYVRAMQNQTGAAVSVHAIADGQAEAVEFLVDEHTLHCGQPLKDLKLKKNILIVSISRGAKSEIPNGDSCFQPGDTLILVTNRSDKLQQLNDIFA